MPISDLFLGVMLGVLAAGLLAFILGRIRWSRNRVGAFFRPQTVTVSSGRTPVQVFAGCLEGILGLVFLLLFIALLVFLVNYFY